MQEHAYRPIGYQPIQQRNACFYSPLPCSRPDNFTVSEYLGTIIVFHELRVDEKLMHTQYIQKSLNEFALTSHIFNVPYLILQASNKVTTAKGLGVSLTSSGCSYLEMKLLYLYKFVF